MTPTIDFLPMSYREAGAQRKDITLRVGVLAVILGLSACAAIYQQHLKSQLARQLTELSPIYQGAVAQQQRLADLEKNLESLKRQADLGVYLEHPWPRSRVLAALFEPLPPAIELESLTIARENEANRPNLPASNPSMKPDAEKVKLHPAQIDLQTLRDEYDGSELVITLQGVTDDPAALHHYLDEIGHVDLFTKVDLSSVERIATDVLGRMQFTARVTLRRGHGQPEGPDGTLTAGQSPKADLR